MLASARVKARDGQSRYTQSHDAANKNACAYVFIAE